MFQVHETMPSESAALASNPCAVEDVPAGVRYLVEHEVPGVVRTATLARPPGVAPAIEVISTPLADPGCGAGASVGTAVAGKGPGTCTRRAHGMAGPHLAEFQVASQASSTSA